MSIISTITITIVGDADGVDVFVEVVLLEYLLVSLYFPVVGELASGAT